MAVERISLGALNKLLTGEASPAQCVIKFYSNSCDLCHALSEYYVDISREYKDLHFFAFNVEDHPTLLEDLGINGVPTITFLEAGNADAKLKILDDPDVPHEKTWYTTKYIKNFIEKETKSND